MSVYKLVTDKLLKSLVDEVNCLRCQPMAAQYTPTSSSDTTGQVGDITYDANYFYIKIATNTWKRVQLNSF